MRRSKNTFLFEMVKFSYVFSSRGRCASTFRPLTVDIDCIGFPFPFVLLDECVG